ncbi:hypothetical protein N9Y42_09565 [Mariniblastus sp.]|nr:hypothetical protein [Mariniblastus sp.]
MSKTSPQPNAGSGPERSKIRAVVSNRGLSGCANDLKWGKLLDVMRTRTDWTPSYRFKCVDGQLSDWDVEWRHHLPFPMMSVEWLDIAYLQETRTGLLTEPRLIDHSDWIVKILDDAKFCYDIVGDVIRIFGYLPKSFDGINTNNTKPNAE